MSTGDGLLREAGGGVARCRILLVDDEPLILRSIHRLLSRSHDVRVASSAEEALSILRDDAGFDVILCDIMMPGMSGIDLYQQLRAEHPPLSARIIFISGGIFTAEADAFVRSIPNPLLHKPFDRKVFEKTLLALVAAKVVSGEGPRPRDFARKGAT